MDLLGHIQAGDALNLCICRSDAEKAQEHVRRTVRTVCLAMFAQWSSSYGREHYAQDGARCCRLMTSLAECGTRPQSWPMT